MFFTSYRTKTYIAGDWDHDKDAVDQLHKWNDSDHWSLSFTDAHDITQAKDSSLNCSIKASLKKRMDASKRFVLIVGNHTNAITAGSCFLCGSYDNYTTACAKGRSVDYRSFIKYECDKAVEAGIKVIVLYKAAAINRSKCPDAVKNLGTHKAMCYQKSDGTLDWNYQAVKQAFEDSDNS